MNADCEMISRIKNNDGRAFSELSEKYSALIHSMINKYSCETMTYEDAEDLHQEAQMLLLKAARTYDSDSGLTFGLYARICIRNGLVTLERKRRRTLKSVDLSDQLSVPDTTDFVDEIESAHALIGKIACVLSKREFSVFRCLTLDYNHDEIAMKLNVSKKSVENTVFRIKKKLGTLLF